MAAGSDRLRIKNIGEFYEATLIVEAYLKDRTVAVEANSLLCSALMKRTEIRNEMVAELARKRGIPSRLLWDQILVGEAEPMTPEIYARSNPLERATPASNDALEVLRSLVTKSEIPEIALQKVAEQLGLDLPDLAAKLAPPAENR